MVPDPKIARLLARDVAEMIRDFVDGMWLRLERLSKAKQESRRGR